MDAVAAAAIAESQHGDESEAEHLSKLVIDIRRSNLQFERLRMRFHRYLHRKAGHRGHSSRA